VLVARIRIFGLAMTRTDIGDTIIEVSAESARSFQIFKPTPDG